jgi:membrane peptidoglycan carboxypeptidase
MSESAQLRSRALAKLATMIVVAGVLVAAALFPWVGGTGLVTRNSSSLLDALPVELTDQTPSGNTKVLAADGSLITEFYENNRSPVTPDQIAPVMKQALVDIEDSRFYEHNGLDVQGTLRALAKNVAAGGVEEGGSTLTQQLVKQTLLQTAKTPEEAQAATAQNVGRKLKEARLALALEQTYSKDEILARYFNIAYFGHGAYGIQAAAQTYFSVNASDLTLPQASVLAGLVQSPAADDPIAHPQAAQNRRNQVLERMHQLGHITDQEQADITTSPVQTVPGPKPPNGCASAAIGGYFCDYLHGYLNDTLKISDTQLDNGGYTIQTTLRPDLQRSGDQSVLARVSPDSTFAGVFTAVQPGTGHVLAMSSNRQYGCSSTEGIQCESVNLNVVPQAGSGSTYKVFTAAAALSAGFGAHYTITAPQPYSSRVYKDWKSGRPLPYTVSNDDENYKATYDMTSGLVASANTYFVALEDALGSITGPVKTSEALGMHYDYSVTQESADSMIKNERGPFTLGYNATSPLDLANSYATIAASGTRCDPTPLNAILGGNGKPATTSDGKPLYTGTTCSPNALAPGVANTLAQMMRGVVSPAGTGRRAQIPGHDIAGKTGTTQSNQNAAFVGMTPDYAASVMYFDPKQKAYVGGVGGGTPGQIWHDAMAPILANEPNHAFPPADPAVEAGTKGIGPGAGSASSSSGTTQRNTGGATRSNGGSRSNGTTGPRRSTSTAPAAPAPAAPVEPSPADQAPVDAPTTDGNGASTGNG